MDYKPYSMEWSRRRYLAEAIQQYFDTDAPLNIVLDDIVDILYQNAEYHQSRALKFQKVLDGLNSLKTDNVSSKLVQETSDDWNGYIPGTDEAKERGCICPILENQEMPQNVRWVDIDCPIHGRKTGTKWEYNSTPLKWNNDYKFVPAPPQENV